MIILLFLPLKLFSVQDTLSNPLVPKNPLLGHYSKGKIITNNFDKIYATDIKLYKNIVFFKNESSDKEQSISLEEITIINAKTGSFWVEGTLLGALGGLIIPFASTNSQSRPSGDVYIYSGLIGAVLGCLIGLCMDNYDTVYHSGDFFLSFKNSKNDLFINKNNFELTTFKFQIFIN